MLRSSYRSFFFLLAILLGLTPFLAPVAFAQTPNPPRRLTFDSRAIPVRWDQAGLWFMRQGDVIHDDTQTHLAQELWHVAPTTGNAERSSVDTPTSQPAHTADPRIRILNGDTPEPELWLFGDDGRPVRRLLKGDGEYFGAIVFAPNNKHFVFTRMPLGSETFNHNSLWLGNGDGTTPTMLIAAASFPVWSPDGNELAFAHAGDVYVVDASSPVTAWTRAMPSNPRASEMNASQALTTPATIRVLHTQANHDFANCRPITLTVGNVLTIPFETYISWVVPTEVGALSSHPERLKTQAVAARTYAWRKILDNAAQPYDVTDWTDTQAMCDFRQHPNSDAAVNATAGQYIAYNGAVIVALYSAENGDPTLSNAFLSSYPYLRAIDDPVSFARPRNGHGQGMSQNGAQRWATQYGWNYIQILTHYYTGVTLEGPTNFGSLNRPWQNFYVTSNHARITGNVSNTSTLNIFASGAGLTSTLIASNTLATSLDLSALPEQPLGAFVISATLSNTQVSTLTLGIDRVPPTGTMTLPITTSTTALTITFNVGDSGPSGFAGYGLSNDWIWEGESQYRFGSAVVSDTAALNGNALFGANGASDIWYGPYTYALPVSQTYRAYFRLKTDNITTTKRLAVLDIVPDATSPIGLKYVYGTDFRAANQYQEFSVDFNYSVTTTTGVEFRVALDGNADVWLDRILIATYPISAPLTTIWTLRPNVITHTVIAKFSDVAGNVSDDVTSTVVFVDPLTNQVYLPLVIR
jgi:hypothetical protein